MMRDADYTPTGVRTHSIWRVGFVLPRVLNLNHTDIYTEHIQRQITSKFTPLTDMSSSLVRCIFP
jgi:hypothetical protein